MITFSSYEKKQGSKGTTMIFLTLNLYLVSMQLLICECSVRTALNIYVLTKPK